MFKIHKKSKKIFKLSAKQVLKCKCVKADQITQQKGLGKPFKFKLPNLLRNFTSLEIDQLLENRVLDLIVSKSNSFLGTEIIQESMSYRDFRQYEGPLTLYLAQVPIDIECPKVLGDKGKVYLWCSKGYTDSGWHYDSFENFLGVVEGVKIVYLKEHCNWKSFEPVYSDEYNHIRPGCFMKGKFVILLKDEMLYIPQGMLHRVVSYDMTTGLNVWMEGINDSIIKPSHYQLRYIMNELVQQDLKLSLRKWSQRRLKKINTISYLEQIRMNEYKLYIRQQSRTVQRKPINYDLGILICLLFKMGSEQMVLFLQQLMKLMDITHLINLETELQCMMAVKLDEYSQEIKNIEQREQFYQQLTPYLQFTESLKLNQKQMTMKIAYQNVLQHLP